MSTDKSNAEFANNLKRLIPTSINDFPKLELGEPYHFDHWADDKYKAPCLYYWFSSKNGTKRHDKRVLISEIYAAFQTMQSTGSFSRASFRVYCPKSESSGRCGFVVVGRILEALGVAAYSGRHDGFVKPTAVR